jgi:DNA-binding PadR family transcriptional regulator
MPEREWLNGLAQLLMLAVARLGDNAYGMTIRQVIQERGGREVPIASIYAALERLERRGCLTSWLADPTPERGGRAKKHFEVTALGAELLRQERGALDQMWEDLELRPGTRSSS